MVVHDKPLTEFTVKKAMSNYLKRREFIAFLGMSAGAAIVGDQVLNSFVESDAAVGGVQFKPVLGPMPVETYGIPSDRQKALFSRFEIKDDLMLPEGYTYNVIASWGDKVGDSRFGFNCDYISFIPANKEATEGYMVVNNEYVGPKGYIDSFEQVIGKKLPFAEIEAALKANKGSLDAYSLPDGNPLKEQIKAVSKEILTDIGISIIYVRKNKDGSWSRVSSRFDRRITGISGLEDGRYLKATGPAVLIFRKKGQGYSDNLGDKCIGTLGNCSGGTTPWGTVLSGEENFQDSVPESVYADGTPFDPSTRSFNIGEEEIRGTATVFGIAGNKMGWMVEVDPSNPNDFGTKHTWLGRFRHEGIGFRVVAGKPLAAYMGCDRRSGHLYKFISKGIVKNPTDKTNSRLFEEGMLYAAKFNPDGTGEWIPLTPDTPVNPDLPSVHAGKMITLPKRPEGGIARIRDDKEINSFKAEFKTLGDLYKGTPLEKQGAILIDAHLAANAAGATCTGRPEDTDVRADGTLFITFTSGTPSSSDGGPNLQIFKEAREFGWIMRLNDDNGNDPAALTFKWAMFSFGGEPADGGLGFSNPDNLEFDRKGNIWMVSDMSTSRHNRPVPARKDKDGKPLRQVDLLGLFGNNSIWYIPTSGPNAGKAYMFGYGPTGCETTGPFLTPDNKTLFLAVQHPGEDNGIRKDMKTETRMYAMRTTDGQEFMQERIVPIGSNWPSKQPNQPPRPSVVAIRRLDGRPV
ncbi:MAG: PhoX family protein [Pseudanabaenaceae cyanobacterium]